MVDKFEDHCWQDLVTQEIMDIYKPYRRDIYVGERPALLGHRPLQPRLPGRSAAGARGGQGVQEFLRRERLRGHRAHQGALRAGARPGTADFLHHHRDAEGGAARRGARHQPPDYGDRRGRLRDIYEAFAPQPDDIIIYKERASGFYGTPLIAHLTRLGISSLIVCGESTSGCVRASVVDAYSNGYHVSIVEECVFDRSIISHKVNLFDLHHKYADLMKLAEVKQHFEEQPLKKAV